MPTPIFKKVIFLMILTKIVWSNEEKYDRINKVK